MCGKDKKIKDNKIVPSTGILYWIDRILSDWRRCLFFLVLIFIIGLFAYLYANLSDDVGKKFMDALGWIIGGVAVPIILTLLLFTLQTTNTLLNNETEIDD